MICPDCEMEFEKLVPSRGVCSSCYKNYYNQMRIKGSYTPLKDLKGTSVYKAAMKKRLANKEKKEKKENNTVEKVKKTTGKRGRPPKLIEPTKVEEPIEIKPKFDESIYNSYLSEVSKDVDLAFKNNEITKKYLDYSDISKWLSMFFDLLQPDNFISESKRAKSVFNDLKLDYQHCLESLDIEDIENVLKWGYMSKILLDLRRPTAEIVDYCDILDPIVKYLQNDKEFNFLLKEAKDKALEKQDIHKQHTYFTRESELVSNEDFVVAKRTKLFDCTVMCCNLFGNPKSSLFRLNGGIRATTKEEAYNKFKSFLQSKFDSLVYEDKDINVKEVQSLKEIPSSGCL